MAKLDSPAEKWSQPTVRRSRLSTRSDRSSVDGQGGRRSGGLAFSRNHSEMFIQ
jgi:hypothetical protein